MINKEKYNCKEKVKFAFNDEVKEGIIVVVNACDTYWSNTTSYDIEVLCENGAWYKHILEKDVISVIE